MKRYLQQYGRTLLENGYAFIPISPLDAKIRDKKTGELVPFKAAGKAPLMKNWESVAVNEDALEEWQKKYFRYGIGIRTWFTPAVDIDCMDVDAAKHMRDFIEANVGFAPARVGRAPKTLLVYCADEPFTKVKSHSWVDDFGEKNAVEILGAGQQFVAFGIHPGTQKPYQWVSKDTPLTMHADMDLEVLSLADARRIVDEFDRYAMEQGWEKIQPGDKLYEPPQRGKIVGGAPEDRSDALGEVDEDDWVDADDAKDKWDGTYAEFAALLEDLPPAEDYSAWFPVIAAIKDAEREQDEFRELAQEWSARASNYDEAAFNDKWDNGNFRRTGGATFTVRSLVKKVEDARMEKDILLRVIPMFEQAEDLYEWDRAAERLRETPVWGTIRDHAVELACDNYKRITGKKIPASTKRNALSVDHKQFDAPAWIEPWVYAEKDNLFINRETKVALVPHAFNNSLAQHTAFMGCSPEQFATALRPVPIIHGMMYYPDMHGRMPGSSWKPEVGVPSEDFFRWQGKLWLNTFDPKTMPGVPEKISKKGLKAVEIVQDFFRTQFVDPEEYRHAMDWLAWVINNPNKRMTYSLVILGGQGSGKTIIKKFMSYLLGRENVGTVNNQVIHRPFTGWQAGSMLKVIEEISVAGHRYDVINSLKEPITNEQLFIERKNREGQDEVNTASWMMYTNDIAALPISNGDRRFLIVRSRFRSKEDAMAFLKDKPGFFKDFEKAFKACAGELRLWFRDWEYSEDFDHSSGIAPLTEATSDMIDNAQDDFTNFVEDAIASDDVAGVTDELIHTGLLLRSVPRDIRPSDSRVASRLSALGYSKGPVKRIQLRVNGVRGSVWMRHPEKWMKDKDTIDYDAMKLHLEEQIASCAAKEVADTWA
ncbi:DNA primase [Cronobacter phage JC01]|uniref:DNA primase n=1 Tax=Cronobacter phage JC01 TaxID=2729575 RepID=A0A6M3YKJ5_9CAUD|nr:DNA primase [Cronobacter phage JC01]QJI52266.1 DNA primase [Cronobacter phage JC01]